MGMGVMYSATFSYQQMFRIQHTTQKHINEWISVLKCIWNPHQKLTVHKRILPTKSCNTIIVNDLTIWCTILVTDNFCTDWNNLVLFLIETKIEIHKCVNISTKTLRPLSNITIHSYCLRFLLCSNIHLMHMKEDFGKWFGNICLILMGPYPGNYILCTMHKKIISSFNFVLVLVFGGSKARTSVACILFFHSLTQSIKVLTNIPAN